MALEPDIQPLGAHRCLLGESPLWHPTEQCLYAVDIPGRQVLRWREGADMPDMWPQDAEPGCIAARAGGGLLVARCLADKALHARAWLIELWRLLRPALLGREAVPPRIWST